MSVDAADPAKNALECMDVGNKGEKPERLMEGVIGFEMSADGKKMMVHKKDEIDVFDSSVKPEALKNPKTLADAKVDLKDWKFSVVPSDEFKEEFLDAWRLHRDYFYDRNMHHIRWAAMRDKYSEFIGRVRDRAELNDLLADMVSELSALHTFVRGGDLRKGPDEVKVASLGAMLERDDAAGGYRIEHIYKTDPDRPDRLSPLVRYGVDAAEGDVITAINGRNVLTADAPSDLLRDQAGRQVLLTLKKSGASERRQTVVKPISPEEDANLRYTEWEYTRRQTVEQKSAGRIAYVHLRAMGPGDMNDWEEQFTPVFDRDGLIIDMRHNRGGNIDSWILGKLMRKAWMYWQARMGAPVWNMQGAFRGHMVVLCDELTASDGEAFTEGFRRLGLGKAIGLRTWGGEIWLSGSNFLSDRGVATAAEMGVYGPERKWLIEGHGVDPDIVVDNLPHATFEGGDAQLDRAISYLQELIRKEPAPVPAAPPFPDKSFDVTKNKSGPASSSLR